MRADDYARWHFKGVVAYSQVFMLGKPGNVKTTSIYGGLNLVVYAICECGFAVRKISHKMLNLQLRYLLSFILDLRAVGNVKL